MKDILTMMSCHSFLLCGAKCSIEFHIFQSCFIWNVIIFGCAGANYKEVRLNAVIFEILHVVIAHNIEGSPTHSCIYVILFIIVLE